MRHLIVCREYPPSPYAAGGIGTYVHHVARLLAEAGETVHVIGQQWSGAPLAIERRCEGRLVVHRVALDEPVPVALNRRDPELAATALAGLLRSESPWQTFSWQASLLAEEIVEREAIEVVEAQEYEAPLYYFQLRRALGLGPERRPPCIVHLHSPTEFIFRHNGWDMARADYLPMKRLEDYSIQAADSLLCPSSYLARQVEAHHALDAGSIEVLPYPIGDTPVVERSAETWAGSTLCYVGRLEPRKGVLEYVDAAVTVARRHPSVRFDFVGSDTSLSGTGGITVGEFVRARIPADLGHRFVFHGAKDRTELPGFLGKAFAAVVPSRWENFPNTCIEAMCSGMPVVASSSGGMAEMIADGRTGWLAAGSSAPALAAAIVRALDTPAAVRAEMGGAASVAVRALCDNAATIRRQIEFRSSLAARGARRSLELPRHLRLEAPALRSSVSPARPSSPNVAGSGVAVVVLSSGSAARLDACLSSIEAQSLRPARLLIAVANASGEAVSCTLDRARARGWQIVAAEHGMVAARNAALQLVAADAAPTTAPLGMAFVADDTQLLAGFLADAEAVLRHRREVGIVSAWSRVAGDRGSSVRVRPCPSFPYQWLSNEVCGCAVFRTEALLDAGPFRIELGGGFETWDAVNAVLACGWAAVTYPALGSAPVPANAAETGGTLHGTNGLVPATPEAAREEMWRLLFVRFADLIGAHAAELVPLIESGSPWTGPFSDLRVQARGPDLSAQVLTPAGIWAAPLGAKLALVRRAVRQPGDASRWILWQLRRSAAAVLPALAGAKRGASKVSHDRP